jgi:hypothetical protein
VVQVFFPTKSGSESWNLSLDLQNAQVLAGAKPKPSAAGLAKVRCAVEALCASAGRLGCDHIDGATKLVMDHGSTELAKVGQIAIPLIPLDHTCYSRCSTAGLKRAESSWQVCSVSLWPDK